MVNEIEGANIRKEWKSMNDSMNHYCQSMAKVGRDMAKSTKYQTLNMECNKLYQWLNQ